jgi:C-terminal processing protease CtpA/Prc
MKIEITDIDNGKLNNLDETIFDMIGNKNKEIILDVSYKGEEISVTVKVDRDEMYVLWSDMQKYNSSNNRLFKDVFGNYTYYEYKQLSGWLSDVPRDID